MVDKNYGHTIILVDSSGSMASMKDDAQGGLNTFIEEQAKIDTTKMTVALYDFSTETRKVYGPLDVKEAPTYELRPRGGTALNDALMQSISETGSFLRKMNKKDRPAKVIFVIITDGQENSSREYAGPLGLNKVKAKITHQTDVYDWEFIYMGANLDAFAEGSSYGMGAIQYQNTGASARGAYGNLNDAFTTSRFMVSQGVAPSSYLINAATDVDKDGKYVAPTITITGTVVDKESTEKEDDK